MNQVDTFFGSAPYPTTIPVGIGEMTTEKGWSEDFLRIINWNKLYEGTELSNPYSQSYVVYRAVRSIAENVPQALFRIHRDGTEVPLDHPIQQLFNKPNPYMSRFEFWESIATFLNLKGEAFLYVNKNNFGKPVELWVFDPDKVKHTMEDGHIVSWIFNNKMPIARDDLIHFKLFNPNNASIRGLSPIEASRQEMEADYSAASYNKIFFDNNATPDGVVEVDKEKNVDVTDLRKLKEMWNEQHQGAENSHKTAFLLGGMSYKNMGINQRDMEFITGRRFSRESILGTFGVPSFVAGFDQDNPNRATALASKRIFWMNTIKPQLMRIQEKLNSGFFAEYFSEYRGWFDYTSIEELQEEYTIKLDNAVKLVSLGYTRNEANERLDLNMPEDPDGDKRHLPMNLVEQGAEAETEPVPEKNMENEVIIKDYVLSVEKLQNYHRNFLQYQKQVEKQFQKKLKRHFFDLRSSVLEIIQDLMENEENGSKVLNNIAEVFEKSFDTLISSIKPIYLQAMEMCAELTNMGLGIDKTYTLDGKLLDFRINLMKGMYKKIYNDLKKELEITTELEERVKGIFNKVSNKSKVIARTETSGIMNGTLLEIYKVEGIRMKRWLSDTDNCNLHSPINDEIIDIHSTFSNGMLYPGDPSGPADETINCRCSISPVVK